MLRRTRRAPAACSWCHRRKVRCDASISGCPCTRCKQDGRTICVLRSKLPKSGYTTNTPRPPINHDSVCIGSLRNDTEAGDPSRALSNSETYKSETNGQMITSVENLYSDEYVFLENETLFLSGEDIAFLTLKGSLTLPSRELALCFVDLYFQFVHPFVPVINECDFWRIWNRQSDKKLSLFLFHALLFASCPYVALDVLSQCGYENKREARKHLYQKAKLLFDLNADIKASAKAQGAILLTHHTSADAPQGGSLWLTRAIENAMVIDSQASDSMMGVPESIRKRIWWCILLRDRSICIGLRRRPQITTLNLDDRFDQLSEADFIDEMQSSTVYDYETKQQLLFAFQEQCGLAVLLTELVCLIFTPELTARCHLGPDELRRHNKRVENITNSLLVWESQAQPAPSVTSQPDIDAPVSTLRSLTFMYYYTARVDLAQYAALFTEEHTKAILSFQNYESSVRRIARELEAGISGLTGTMEYFSLNGNVEHLPLSVLAYAAMPLVLAAINLKLSPSSLNIQKSKKTLDSISNIIRHSESLYDVTDVVAAGTNQILQLAYLVTQNIIVFCHPPSEPHMVQGKRTAEAQVLQQNSHGTQPKNWVEAFIRVPRAYLLISTCVDYSLACGCLPSGDSLPLSVRQLVSRNGIGRLPWTITPRQDDPRFSPVRRDEQNTDDPLPVYNGLTARKRLKAASSSSSSEAKYTEVVQSPASSTELDHDQRRDKVGANTQHGVSTVECYGSEPMRKPKHWVNLDFLDLSSDDSKDILW